MLIEFSVGNFRSFKDIVTLSMMAAKLIARDKALDENNVFEVPGAPPLLTSAAIYGANASGKSNLVGAIGFMRDFVLNSPKETRAKGAIGVEPFRLNRQTSGKPSHFEMIFVVDGQRHRYGFELTQQVVEREWLYVVPTTREALLFERTRDEVKLGERFGEGTNIIEKTRPNALFLSVVALFNGSHAQKLVESFRQIGVLSGLHDFGMLVHTIRLFLDGENRQQIVELIKKLDLGIEDIDISKISAPVQEIPDSMPEALRAALQAIIDLPDSEHFAVKTIHTQYDADLRMEDSVAFDLERHESEGTKKLFALAGTLVSALRSGQLIIVDELDARLHPLMTREIIKLFNSKTSNPDHAQLIFTTQDTNLLDNRLLRRDQVWFTEKDRQGATQLYSLAEFKVRNDASFESDYIQGRYGAIPFLGDLRHVIEVG